MTSMQPGAPAQPAAPAAPAAPGVPNAVDAQAGALADQLDAVNRASEEATRRAEARAGQEAPMGVVRDANGRVVITGRDGRQIIVDPKVVNDEDEVANMVRTALAPPPIPEPRRGSSGADVAIVSIIFPCLIVVMLIIWRIVATSKRPGAAAAGMAPEVADRLSRIEQAIEAVAIEVERISESERYSARLLTERLPQPAGDARALATAEARRDG